MLDRRGFLAAMLGVAVAPKDVLSGIASPAPVKAAMADWCAIWTQAGAGQLADGWSEAWTVTISVPEELGDVFKGFGVRVSSDLG